MQTPWSGLHLLVQLPARYEQAHWIAHRAGDAERHQDQGASQSPPNQVTRSSRGSLAGVPRVASGLTDEGAQPRTVTRTTGE
jgi:hypothetical protein